MIRMKGRAGKDGKTAEQSDCGSGPGNKESKKGEHNETGEYSMKRITVLGSTGSIGTQTLDVIEKNPYHFAVAALACGHNMNLLRAQIDRFHPQAVAVADERDAKTIAKEYPHLSVAWGARGMDEMAAWDCDIVLNAFSGIRGLSPCMHAIAAGHDLALANKESLVTAGALVMRAVREAGVLLLPVDSEHCAIFQSMAASPHAKINRILLTASGGPFRGYSRERLQTVTPEDALRHPNWSMGSKISVDSATMLNKGLEVIEAYHLFGVPPEKIEVLVHPESILHSAVEFADHAIIGQFGVPDMRIPISVALGFPERIENAGKSLDLTEIGSLTFEKPDLQTFRCLALALDAARAGGSFPLALNAANEVLVRAFLEKRIPFTDIARLLEETLEQYQGLSTLSSIDAVLAEDKRVRAFTEERICHS